MRRLTAMAFVLTTTVAGATDHVQEAAKLTMRQGAGAASLVWSTRLPKPTPPSLSPTQVGATLEIMSSGGEGAMLDLPASGWTANGAGTTFAFRNKLAPGGPTAVKAATLANGRVLKVAAKSTGISLDEAAQGTMGIRLTVGGDIYCSVCTTPRRDQPGRFTAVRCAAPATCDGVGTPTTTTDGSLPPPTTTTTTQPAPFCGNGVVDQASEQCDGSDFGHCLDNGVPDFTAVGCDAPGLASECTCCVVDHCMVAPGSGDGGCCAEAGCQDITGAGSVRLGACVPATCTQDADCHGYRCVGGTCCGNAGQLCGVAGCCADSGATCAAVPFSSTPACCRAGGATCITPTECCTGSCTAGTCD